MQKLERFSIDVEVGYLQVSPNDSFEKSYSWLMFTNRNDDTIFYTDGCYVNIRHTFIDSAQKSE